jgi:hypothetical protein
VFYIFSSIFVSKKEYSKKAKKKMEKVEKNQLPKLILGVKIWLTVGKSSRRML